MADKLTLAKLSKRVEVLFQTVNGFRGNLKELRKDLESSGSDTVEVRKLLDDAAEKYEGFAKDIVNLHSNQALLIQNQNQLSGAYHDVTDKFFGVVELLRELSPEFAEVLSDERVVGAANAHRRERLARMKEAQDRKEVEELLKADKSGEPEANEDRGPMGVPDGALVFGGGE